MGICVEIDNVREIDLNKVMEKVRNYE